jgi:hypothetical protein
MQLSVCYNLVSRVVRSYGQKRLVIPTLLHGATNPNKGWQTKHFYMVPQSMAYWGDLQIIIYLGMWQFSVWMWM